MFFFSKIKYFFYLNIFDKRIKHNFYRSIPSHCNLKLNVYYEQNCSNVNFWQVISIGTFWLIEQLNFHEWILLVVLRCSSALDPFKMTLQRWNKTFHVDTKFLKLKKTKKSILFKCLISTPSKIHRINAIMKHVHRHLWYQTCFSNL